jgi:drug/metabolite transporter (DMT)-like permease
MRRFVGILLVVISATTFGTLAIFGRFAYASGIGVTTILCLRFLISAGVMSGLLAARGERLPGGTVLISLVGMGAIGYVGQSLAYFSALKHASAGLVALLLYLYPAFVAILSSVVLHERLTRDRMLALAVALTGTALTVGPAGGQFLGIVLAISAAAIYSGYIIVGSRVMRQVSAIQSSTVIFVSAGVVFAALTALSGPTWPVTAAGWWAIGGMVVLGTVVPVVTFLAGIERIGPTNAAMVSTLEPAVTVVLATALLGEALPPIAIVGGVLILAGVLLLARAELRPTVASPPPEIRRQQEPVP